MNILKQPMMLFMTLIMLGGIVYTVQGVLMHNQVNTEEVLFHDLQSTYWIQSKAIRDGANSGSQLNKDLVTIKNYPSTLLQLKLVGVGKILTGIFVVLFGILTALIMMPKRLAAIIREQKG